MDMALISFIERLKKIKIQLFGNGEEVRDHICVDDVKSFLKILQSRKFSNYNFVTGKEISFMHIAKIIQNFYIKIKIKEKEKCHIMVIEFLMQEN